MGELRAKQQQKLRLHSPMAALDRAKNALAIAMEAWPNQTHTEMMP